MWCAQKTWQDASDVAAGGGCAERGLGACLVLRAPFPLLAVALEERPTYLATKSDYYTHAMVLPSQNGPGYGTDEARDPAARIFGMDGAWRIPCELPDDALEPLALLQAAGGEPAARYEAAYALITRAETVTRFAARGAAEPGKPAFPAELADPNAEPNETYLPSLDICLRHVATALLIGADAAAAAAHADLSGHGRTALLSGWEAYEADDGRTYYWNDDTGETVWSPPTGSLEHCLAYLRDRVGVPRDMGPAAAMQLRAHLNWAIAFLLDSSDNRVDSTNSAIGTQ
jgi:glutathione S-transferase